MLRNIIFVARIGVCKSCKSSRTIIALIFSYLTIYALVLRLTSLSEITGYGITPYLMPFYYEKSLAYGIIILLTMVSAAPFIDSNSYMVMSRVTTLAWYIGQILHMFIMFIIYIISFFVFNIVALIPCISFSKDWGAVIYISCLSTFPEKNGILISDFKDNIFVEYLNPIQATMMQALIVLLLGMIIGMIVFILNGITKSIFGVIVVLVAIYIFPTIYAMIDSFKTEISIDEFYNNKPVYSFLDYTNLNILYNKAGIRYGEIILVMFSIFLVMAIIGYILIKKRRIQTIL